MNHAAPVPLSGFPCRRPNCTYVQRCMQCRLLSVHTDSRVGVAIRWRLFPHSQVGKAALVSVGNGTSAHRAGSHVYLASVVRAMALVFGPFWGAGFRPPKGATTCDHQLSVVPFCGPCLGPDSGPQNGTTQGSKKPVGRKTGDTGNPHPPAGFQTASC